MPSRRQMVCAEQRAKQTVEKTLEMRAAERVETRISEIGQVLRTDLAMLEKVYSLVFDSGVLKETSEEAEAQWPSAYKHLRRCTNQGHARGALLGKVPRTRPRLGRCSTQPHAAPAPSEQLFEEG
eukprot:6462828-Amphidinium_carterae.1